MLSVIDSYRFIKYIMESDDLTREQKLKFTKSIKQDLRKVMKPLQIDPFEETYHGDRGLFGECYYIKEFFDVTFTEEEKEEMIKDQWRHLNCPYDCSGLSFTQRITICNFKEPNSFGALSCMYHFIGIDI